MITIEELNEIKERRKTNLYYEEKEYLQYIFLNAISRYPDIVFKGGTCLRICYGLQRASEDLDFSSNLALPKIKDIVKRCLREFDFLNIEYKIYSQKDFKGNIRIEIRFYGPLFNGHLNSTNTLKIDFNNQKVINLETKVINKLFSDVPLFTLNVLSEKEILAEKIRTMANRTQAKDIYDLWILNNKGVEIDKKLILKKLREEGSKLSDIKILSKSEYLQGLKNLITVIPPYEQVYKEISDFLKSLHKK
ncbi:protein containing DUF1814 domain [sediment metagenome]|uniref:Protein containing DUF1814 domain n=1 Tax=sediment metagenome TaxID=749907 RepID=D9PJC8_9ZZZZ